MNTDAIDAEHTAIAVAQPVGEIAARPPSFFDTMRPAEKLAFAVEVADVMKSVIDKKRLGHHLNKKKPEEEYVELEAWQTCAFMCGMSAKVEWVKPIDKGFEARAIVVRMDSGLEIGSGESRCTRDEKRWAYADDYAVSGMAQTRSQSRALRGVLAWILVLSGFKPTPAEEMPEYQPKAAAKPATVADDSARKMGVEAVRRMAAKRGLPVPETDGLTVDGLRSLWQTIKDTPEMASSAPPAPPSPQPDSKAASEPKAQPGASEAAKRQNMLAAIHICKNDRHLSDELYRALMVDLFGDDCYDGKGIPSSKMLTPEQMHTLLDEIKDRV